MASFLRLHPSDNVVVAVNGLSPGDIVDDVKITRRIPPGHKAAVRPIKKDAPALKEGDTVTARVIKVDKGDRKIALSIKAQVKGSDRSTLREYMNQQEKPDTSIGALLKERS